MSSTIPKVRESNVLISQPNKRSLSTFLPIAGSGVTESIGKTTSKLWRSEGHPINRKTGKYDSGGPFHVTHSGPFLEPGSVTNICNPTSNYIYSGPVFGRFTESTAIGSNYSNSTAEMNESSLMADGSTAISQCAPVNPTAGLASSLAESFREGIPSLPGIQSWKKRTEILQAAGSEYLNYQFGWAPLKSEVDSVVNAARHHRDIMQNYRHNEGRDVHRRFDFSTETQRWDEEVTPSSPVQGILSTQFLFAGAGAAQRVTSVERQRKRWFEGCFTYGGPSKTDSFGRAIGFGSEADAVYGLPLSPDVLWNLTPWSWAVDWFTNTGDLIHNVTNFALAGLVMRYGYMMEETTYTYYTSWGDGNFIGCDNLNATSKKFHLQREGSGRRGLKTVSKSRVPASPFGFGVSWDGLSPTQLAITAAIGITRFL